jgi:hypothetical protein
MAADESKGGRKLIVDLQHHHQSSNAPSSEGTGRRPAPTAIQHHGGAPPTPLSSFTTRLTSPYPRLLLISPHPIIHQPRPQLPAHTRHSPPPGQNQSESQKFVLARRQIAEVGHTPHTPHTHTPHTHTSDSVPFRAGSGMMDDGCGMFAAAAAQTFFLSSFKNGD